MLLLLLLVHGVLDALRRRDHHALRVARVELPWSRHVELWRHRPIAEILLRWATRRVLRVLERRLALQCRLALRGTLRWIWLWSNGSRGSSGGGLVMLWL